MNIVKKWNKNHAVGMYGSKAVICDGHKDWKDERITEFKKLCNDYVLVGLENEKKKKIKEIDIWLDSHDRNEFDQIVFNPGLTPGYCDRTVNTYMGLAIQPLKGAVDPFLAHLEQNVCHNNTDWYDYLIQWMAHIVQHPEIKTEVALVLQGDEGVGKGIIANYFGRIFGRYYIRLDSTARITSNFNDQLEKCILCNADEAVCVYDRKGLGVLKSLITDKEFAYEKKYHDIKKGKNYTNLIIISNDERIVAPSASDRRYFVLQVKNNWYGNRPVWNKMASMMNNNGPAALLYYLQQIHLTRDLKKIPKTVWHREQEILSEDSVKACWRQFIDEHDVEDYQEDSLNCWPQDLYKDRIYEYYLNYSKGKYTMNKVQFFKKLKKFLPDPKDHRGTNGKRFYKLSKRELCLERL